MNDLFKQAQTYVGMPYTAGVFDCADLAALVQREVFGRVVDLPVNRPRPGGVRGQAREVNRLQADVADRVAVPGTGCGVLLHDGTEPAHWHVGTVFLHGGDVWVLHNSMTLGSAALHRLADLRRFGLVLEGFYDWRVAP